MVVVVEVQVVRNFEMLQLGNFIRIRTGCMLWLLKYTNPFLQDVKSPASKAV
jgi:hypothetical protein